MTKTRHDQPSKDAFVVKFIIKSVVAERLTASRRFFQHEHHFAFQK